MLVPTAAIGGLAVAVALGLVPIAWVILLAILGALGCAAFALGQRAVFFLDRDEQLLVEGLTGTTVLQGPSMKYLNPFSYRSATRRKAVAMSAMEFCKVRNTMNGEERIERGPRLLFLGAYDKVQTHEKAKCLGSNDYLIVEDKLSGTREIVRGPCMWFPGAHDKADKNTAVTLSGTQYIVVEDKLSGDKHIVKGPCVWFPKPYDSAGPAKEAIPLQEEEYLRLKDTASGNRWVQKGRTLVFLEPTWQVEGASKDTVGVRKAWALKACEYVRLVDSITGKVTAHRGEKTVFPGPDERLLDGEVLRALDLKVQEYVKIMDKATGEMRVERGDASGSRQVFLEPNDAILDGGKKKAVEVDEDHAVLVRDKASGQVRLVTEKQLFVPGPNEIVEEVRVLIRLADHEAMILKGSDGDFQFRYGSEAKRKPDEPRSFFLPPFTEIVQLCWSKGRRRETRNLFIQRFDCRPQFMSFEFNCRTSDNVELILEGTFFWEVIDLPAMVKSTGDTSGDLCNHARSQFIRHVARVTLKEFMDSSHLIAKKVWEEDTSFFDSRGVKIHSLEVTRYCCADKRTSRILEEIIQETTNRMNRLSQAESENEVSLFRMQGQIEQTKVNGDLLKIQHEHNTNEAEVLGEAEAARISAFMKGLTHKVPDAAERISMWQVLRKTEALEVVSQAKTNLYFTPSDVDLSVGRR